MKNLFFYSIITIIGLAGYAQKTAPYRSNKIKLFRLQYENKNKPPLERISQRQHDLHGKHSLCFRQKKQNLTIGG